MGETLSITLVPVRASAGKTIGVCPRVVDELVSPNESLLTPGGRSVETAPLPRLRPGVDAAPVPPEHGDNLICLFDRQDPTGGQVVTTRVGLLLASLLDGSA